MRKLWTALSRFLASTTPRDPELLFGDAGTVKAAREVRVSTRAEAVPPPR